MLKVAGQSYLDLAHMSFNGFPIELKVEPCRASSAQLSAFLLAPAIGPCFHFGSSVDPRLSVKALAARNLAPSCIGLPLGNPALIGRWWKVSMD